MIYPLGKKFRFPILFLSIAAALVMVGTVLELKNLYSRIEALNSFTLDDVSQQKYEIARRELELLEKDLTNIKQSDSLFNIGKTPNFLLDTVNKYNLGQLQVNGNTKQIFINLYALNNYFISRKLDERTYFELFDKNGICLISPKTEKIGQKYNIASLKNHDRKHLQYDYLSDIEVYNRTFSSNNLVKHGTLIVVVPVFTLQERIEQLTNPRLFLGISGLVLIGLLLYFFIKEQRKVERLQLLDIQRENEQNRMNYFHLREQFNPHFLFNSLGALSHIIDRDPQLSKKFALTMSKFYRKVIKMDSEPLATLSSEVELLENYIFIQQIRFGKGINNIELTIPGAIQALKIPRFCLQMLAENAIKHNQFSPETPLRIQIIFDLDQMFIRFQNSVAPRTTDIIESNEYGLKYLESVYSLLSVTGFGYHVIDGAFVVNLPLIK